MFVFQIVVSFVVAFTWVLRSEKFFTAECFCVRNGGPVILVLLCFLFFRDCVCSCDWCISLGSCRARWVYRRCFGMIPFDQGCGGVRPWGRAR